MKKAGKRSVKNATPAETSTENMPERRLCLRAERIKGRKARIAERGGGWGARGEDEISL